MWVRPTASQVEVKHNGDPDKTNTSRVKGNWLVQAIEAPDMARRQKGIVAHSTMALGLGLLALGHGGSK